MIRGIIYLTGLVTLTVIALVVAFVLQVHKWPWKDYIETGRQEIVETLDPDTARGGADPLTPVVAEPRSSAPRARETLEVAGAPEVYAPRRPDEAPPAAAPSARRPAVDAAGPLVCRHEVRRNETLYGIAVRYYGAGERWRTIARANGILSPSDLQVGRVIVIPFETRGCEDGTDVTWAPDLRLQFAPAGGGDSGRDEGTER
jgi:hypothetical protein